MKDVRFKKKRRTEKIEDRSKTRQEERREGERKGYPSVYSPSSASPSA
jgi:hypothetical protein